MPYVRKSRSKKSSTSKKKVLRKKIYKKRAPRATAFVKRVVKKVLSRTTETKCQTYDWSLTPLCLQQTTGTLNNNYVVINPSNATGNTIGINRGTGSGQMIGDKIRLKSAVLDYVITLTGYNATTNPQPMPVYLRAYIYKYKKAPQNDPQVTNICGSGINANFFEIGTSDIGFQGTLIDLNQKLNSDAYTYYGHRTWKLGNMISAAGATPGSPVYSYSNNDFKMSSFGKWNVSRYLPKIMSRDDNGVWQNDYVVIMFQVVSALGGLLSNVNTQVNVQLNMDLKYTDA